MSVKMYADCNLCESSVRQDLMPIHIKHYHNIPHDKMFTTLLKRIETLEKQVAFLKKENAKRSTSTALTKILPPGLSHIELKKLCQNVRQLDSFYYKTAMAMIKGSDLNKSISNDEANDTDKADIEKVIVNLEPCIATALSNFVEKCQSTTKEKETQDLNTNIPSEQMDEKKNSDEKNDNQNDEVNKNLENSSKRSPSPEDIFKSRENKHYIRKRKPINFTMADLEMESAEDDPEFDFDDEKEPVDIFKKPKLVQVKQPAKSNGNNQLLTKD